MDPRQTELDYCRTKLNLEPLIIYKVTKAPFLESLREYCIDKDENFHLEIQYRDENSIATLYMTVGDLSDSISGNIGQCDFMNRDDLDDLEDKLAKRYIAKL